MHNDDISQLLLPPKDIDLSQAFSVDPMRGAQSSAPAGSPVEALKGIMTELSTRQMEATQTALDNLAKNTDTKLDAMASAINPELNELQRQIDGQREEHFRLSQVLDSFLKLYLFSNGMPKDLKDLHTQVLVTFLQDNAPAIATEERINN